MSAIALPSEPKSKPNSPRVERLLQLEEQYQGLTLRQIFRPLPGESDKQTVARLEELFELIPALAGVMLLEETQLGDELKKSEPKPEPSSEPESERLPKSPSPDQSDVFQKQGLEPEGGELPEEEGRLLTTSPPRLGKPSIR